MRRSGDDPDCVFTATRIGFYPRMSSHHGGLPGPRGMMDHSGTMPAVARVFDVVGIAGSLRRGSYNRALLRAAAELAPPGLHIVIHELDQIPLYNGDVE